MQRVTWNPRKPVVFVFVFCYVASKVLMSGENKEYIEQCWMPKNAECENENLMHWRPETIEHEQNKLMSGVIRGRGANGAPKFFKSVWEIDVLWLVQMRRRVSEMIWAW
jgi:hypothetical protein